MAEIDPVILELRADLARYRNELKSTTTIVDRSLQQQERAVARLEQAYERSGGAIAGSVRAIGAALSGIVTIQAAKQFLAIADASKQIDAQLRLATQSFGSFTQAQDDARRISSDVRAGLAETTSLYGNFIRATQTLGGTQDDAARATETFSKALKLGGADAASAASATLQFGQALASGVLRGDEFNSIAEASPRLLQLLADAIGKPRAELRKLAEDGKLTSDVLFRALTDRRFTEGIDTEFQTLPVTFGEAMQQIQNAAVVTFGAFDRGGEFSTALANFITQGADGFGQLERDAEELGVEIRSTLAGLFDVFEPMVSGAQSAFAAIGADSRSVAQQIREDITNILSLYDRATNIGTAIERGAARTGNALIRGGVINRNFVSGGRFAIPEYSNVVGSFDQRRRNERALAEARAQERRIASGLSATGNFRPSEARDFINGSGRFAPRAPFRPTSDGKKARTPRGPSAETLEKRAEAQRQRELRNDEAFEREKADLNQDLLRARAAIAGAAETTAQFEIQEIEAARARQEASYQADVAQKRLTQARADQLIALNNQVAAERKREVELREADRVASGRLAIASADIDTARELASLEADLANTAQERKNAQLRILSLEIEQERIRLDGIVASRTATEAEKEIARRRLAALGQIEAGGRAAIERDNESPLQRYNRRLNRSSEDLRRDAEELVVQELDQVRNGISQAITDRLGVKDPLISGLLDIFIEQVLLKPIAEALSKGGGGTSGILQGIGTAVSSFFGGRASGGPVAAGQLYRVNEGASPGRVEGFRPAGSGTVIPLGQMNAMRPAGGVTVVQNFTLDARQGITTPQLLQGVNALIDEKGKGIAAQGAQLGAGLAAKQQRNARIYGS